MMGRLASSWLDVQGLYYTPTGSPCSASLWMSRLYCELILNDPHNVVIPEPASWFSSVATDPYLHESSYLGPFQQGMTNLLPVDQFYVTPGSHSFSLQQVLDLLPDNQLLWLHAVSNAQTRGQNFPRT